MPIFHRPSRRTSKPSFVSYLSKGNGKDEKSSRSTDRLSLSVLDEDRVSMGSMSGTLKRDGLTIPDNVFAQLEPSYLPGEVEIASAVRVMRYIPFSDCKQGAMGSLYVTNFRITFLPVKQNNGSLLADLAPSVWKNKLYEEDDIILNNVEAAYQVSRGHRRRLVAGKHSDRSVLKKIEIHCKNFRIHQFSLECCGRESANKVADGIAHFSFVDKVDRQFAFFYKGDTSCDYRSSIPEFHDRRCWEKEVLRLHAKSFKVTDCNEDFRDSQFMPKYFVVPSAMNSEKIRKAFACFEDYRFPVWSYSHTNGSSLLRMTFPLATYFNPQDVENSFLDSIKQIHPEHKRPLVYDVHECFPVTPSYDPEEKLKLPTVKDIRHSFLKLRDICMSVTVKEIENSDGSWFGSVDSTKWLAHVSSCLKVTDRIAQIMTGNSFDIDKRSRRVSIVVKEHDGAKDLTPLITCLVQIILDPHARTIEGFQKLVEREWVALGHRFKDRYGIVVQLEQEEKQCPIFLLYLDCVWQLVQQLPKSFEYTETYLIALWDCVCSGLFANFLFNSQHEMVSELGHRDSSDRFSRLGEKTFTNNLLNVWDWSKQYTEEDLAFFRNPVYEAKESSKADPDSRISKQEPQRRIRILSKYYKEKPSDCFIDLDLEEDPPPPESPVLYPQWSICRLELWATCYLRWSTPVQVVGGGTYIECLLQGIVSDEIKAIQDKLQLIEEANYNGVYDTSRMESALNIWDPSILAQKRRLLENMTSSFPYTPSRPTAQVTFFGAQPRMTAEDLTSSSEMESSFSSASEMLSS